MVEENVEAKIYVSCCALEVRVDEKLAELTSSVEVIIKPLGELIHNSIVEAVDTYIVETVETYLGEEKDKEKSCLKVTVHNVPESTSDQGQERKQHDTDEVNYIFQKLTHNSIVETVDTYMGEEKDKEKRRLKVTVHNVPESTSDEGQERKQHDTDEVNYIVQQYLG